MKDRHSDLFRGTFSTLESFVDRVSEVLQCLVTLEDAHHQLLAYSRHNDQEQTDSARIETIIRRRVPEKVIYRLWKDGIIPELLQTKEPVFVEERPDIGLRGRVAISIWKDEEVLGFIWLLDMKERLKSTAIKKLEQAALVASNLLTRRQSNKQHLNEDTQELFWKMLTGHKWNDPKITLPVKFAVVVFRFKEILSENLEQRALYFMNTSEKVSIPFYTIEGKDLIVLAGYEHSKLQPLDIYKQFILTFQKNISEYLDVIHLDAGLGGIYDQPYDVAKSFKEAKAVLDVHKKFPADTQEILSYQELGIYQFLDIIFQKRIQDGFENPVIEKLMAYDRKNKTQLIETLKTYLNENENAGRASEKLHIHVNTLGYRLQRIIEITGLDLSKPNQKMMLYLDLKLLHLRKETIIT